MRRLIAIVVLLVATLVSATPAEAFHRHWGWRGGWGHHGWAHRGWAHRGWGWGGGFRGGPAWGWGNAGWGNPGWGGPCYGVGFQPVYYSPGFYQVNSPWFFAANEGGMNFNVPAGINLPASVNNPMYASSTRGPTVTLIATTARPDASASFAAAPGVSARPVGRVAANAVQQFLGMSELRPINLIDVRMAMNPEAAEPPTVRFPTRISNVESRRKAERMIAEADELFKAQTFNSALQRYKLAVSTAPDLAEAHWRQGHALIATRNYALAATAFKRAIALTDDLGRGGFRLNDIYGGAMMTKSQHLESLAEWAITKRDSADSYFLLGLFFEYDGQPARAKKFFQKASDLAGISGGHIGVFLDPGEPVLLRTIERTAAKPAAGIPVIIPSASRDI